MGSVVAGFLSKTNRNVGTLEYTIKTPVSVKKTNDWVSWDLPPQRGRWELSSEGWWPGHDGSEPLLDWTSPACSISCPHHTYKHMCQVMHQQQLVVYHVHIKPNARWMSGQLLVRLTKQNSSREMYSPIWWNTFCFSSYKWVHFSRAVLYSQRSWVLSATTIAYHIHTILRDGSSHRQQLNFASLCYIMPKS